MQEFSDKVAPYQIPFEAYGVEMRVCASSPELLEHIKPLLPPVWRRRPRSSKQVCLGMVADENDIYSIYSDGVCIHDAPGRHFAMAVMEQTLENHVSLGAPDLTFVHAGVVADGDRAVVIPGLSFSGKTTLVRALVEAGAAYFSDEFAVLDEDGRVHPYPRTLTFRPPGGGLIGYNVDDLGGVTGTDPLPIGMLIATCYRRGAEWQPRELSPGAAVLAMLQHAMPARVRPEQTMRTLTRAVDGAVALQGERGEADEFATILLDTLRATV